MLFIDLWMLFIYSRHIHYYIHTYINVHIFFIYFVDIQNPEHISLYLCIYVNLREILRVKEDERHRLLKIDRSSWGHVLEISHMTWRYNINWRSWGQNAMLTNIFPQKSTLILTMNSYLMFWIWSSRATKLNLSYSSFHQSL